MMTSSFTIKHQKRYEQREDQTERYKPGKFELQIDWKQYQ